MTTKVKNPIVYVPVYIPDTPDCEYKFGERKLSKEKIKYLARTFNKYKIIDLQHEYGRRLLDGKKPIQRGEVLGSYITSKKLTLKGLDGLIRQYPEGTWILKIKITDKTAMMLYYKGQLSGVSATAKRRNDANFLLWYASRKSVDKVPRRILLSSIKDPVVFTVSLVKKPCVYGAKFCNKSCMIKNTKYMEDNSMSIMDTIKEKLNTALEDIDLEELEESRKSEEEEIENIEEEEQTEPEEAGEEGTGEEEETDEEEIEEQLEEQEESAKSYVTKEEVKDMFKTGFQQVRGELETMVDSTITESISALQESQKEALGYVTGDDVKSIFEEEFTTFKTDFEKELKERQEESIKQFSKTIDTQTTPVVENQQEKEQPVNKLFADRDANGCKIR
ncbi:MAG: hypothetical protein J6V44_03570 [Methanobrevibacter sp.]|nr:hypothetical protein [Methanobrevibacter sp.]